MAHANPIQIQKYSNDVDSPANKRAPSKAARDQGVGARV